MKNQYQKKLLEDHRKPGWDPTHGCRQVARLAKLFNVKRFVEVGVCLGHTAAEVLDACNLKQYYMIDTWPDLKKYQLILDNFDSPKTTIYRGDSVKAAQKFYAKLVDMVYLDTFHTFDQTLAEIRAWYSLIRKGGILVGDGYGYKLDKKEQVTAAVHQIFPPRMINVNKGPDYIYWIVRE